MVALRGAGGYGGRGATRFSWNGRQVLQTIEHAGERAANRVGQEAKAYAETIAPVDTGELREGIDYEVHQTSTGWTIVLFNPVDHAVFQELGTSKMAAQPSLRPAADAVFPKYGQYVKEAVGAG